MQPDEQGAVLLLVDEQRTFIDQNDHTWLVIHKTASGGTAQDIARFFATDPRMASTHYVVGQDGTIVQCVLEKDGAGGNCCLETGHASFLPLGINLNVKTVSIEHVDPATDNSTPLTEAQKEASFRLVRDICERHNIPMRRGDSAGGIIGHYDIAPLSRARCPGNYPWDELFNYLENGGQHLIAYNTPGIKPFFTETDPNHWLCLQTRKIIQYGMLDAYKKYGNKYLCGLTYLGLPLGNEIPIEHIQPKDNPTKYAHLAGKGITVQPFECGDLVYDPQHLLDIRPAMDESVFPAHINDGAGLDLLITIQKVPMPEPPPPPPTIQGIDPNHVKNFQQALELQAHDLVAKAQALESAIIVPVV